MNLLYLAEDYPYSKVHHQLCKHIVSSGKNINVKVSAVLRANILLSDLRPTYTDVNYQVLLYKQEKDTKRYKYDFFFKIRRKTLWIVDNIDVKNINMIYAATLFSEGAVAYKLYKRYAIPYIVAIRSTDVNLYLKYMFHLWPLGWSILKNAYKIVFITEAIVHHCLDKKIMFPVRKLVQQKMEVIPNGIESYWHVHAENKRREEKPRHLLFIGSFDDNKNILAIMRVVKTLSSRYKGIHLKMVGGGGNQHEKVLEYCHKYPSLFTYLGKIFDKDELCKVFSESDIFVMASHRETFGLVYIEALSQGLPVLYTRGQGIDGMFKEKVGEKVNSYNENSIREAICLLIDKYEQYEPIGDSLCRFSWNKIACDIIKLFR